MFDPTKKSHAYQCAMDIGTHPDLQKKQKPKPKTYYMGKK